MDGSIGTGEVGGAGIVDFIIVRLSFDPSIAEERDSVFMGDNSLRGRKCSLSLFVGIGLVAISLWASFGGKNKEAIVPFNAEPTEILGRVDGAKEEV